MKTSEVFMMACLIMQYSKDRVFICKVIDDLDISQADRERAKQIIYQRLDPYPTVATWAMGEDLPGVMYAQNQDFRAFRIRWLKALVEEFSAKGD